MSDIVNNFLTGSNQSFVVICLSLAVFRVYLEFVGFDFLRLPLTKLLGDRSTKASLEQFHRMGFFVSVGYIILFAPSLLLS